jgi:hypothetical protein
MAETFQPLSDSEKVHYTNLWCRELGIKSVDLGCGFTRNINGKIVSKPQHPALDDVILLIKVRQEFWTFFNAHEKGVWAGYWNTVYHYGFPMKVKAIKKIETLVSSGIYKKSQRKLQAEKIKQLRKHTTKRGHNMTANESLATDSLIRV